MKYQRQESKSHHFPDWLKRANALWNEAKKVRIDASHSSIYWNGWSKSIIRHYRRCLSATGGKLSKSNNMAHECIPKWLTTRFAPVIVPQNSTKKKKKNTLYTEPTKCIRPSIPANRYGNNANKPPWWTVTSIVYKRDGRCISPSNVNLIESDENH